MKGKRGRERSLKQVRTPHGVNKVKKCFITRFSSFLLSRRHLGRSSKGNRLFMHIIWQRLIVTFLITMETMTKKHKKFKNTFYDVASERRFNVAAHLEACTESLTGILSSFSFFQLTLSFVDRRHYNGGENLKSHKLFISRVKMVVHERMKSPALKVLFRKSHWVLFSKIFSELWKSI